MNPPPHLYIERQHSLSFCGEVREVTLLAARERAGDRERAAVTTRRHIVAGFWFLSLGIGCATAATAPPPVPPLISESMPRPPVAAEQLVWQPGHWDWTGAKYAWKPGQYVPTKGH